MRWEQGWGRGRNQRLVRCCFMPFFQALNCIKRLYQSTTGTFSKPQFGLFKRMRLPCPRFYLCVAPLRGHATNLLSNRNLALVRDPSPRESATAASTLHKVSKMKTQNISASTPIIPFPCSHSLERIRTWRLDF